MGEGGLQTVLLLRSDAHVPNVRSASVLAKHRFRHALTHFQTISE
jgi:hypothetical protein